MLRKSRDKLELSCANLRFTFALALVGWVVGLQLHSWGCAWQFLVKNVSLLKLLVKNRVQKDLVPKKNLGQLSAKIFLVKNKRSCQLGKR